MSDYEDLVEACAKAIYALIPNGGVVWEQTTATSQDGWPVRRQKRVDDTWEEAPDRHEQCRDLARVVLAEIAEAAKDWPTDDMAVEALTATFDAQRGGDRVYSADVPIIWRAMLAASPLTPGMLGEPKDTK